MAKFTRSSRRSYQLNGLLAFDHHKWYKTNFCQLLSKCLGGIVLKPSPSPFQVPPPVWLARPHVLCPCFRKQRLLLANPLNVALRINNPIPYLDCF